MISESGQATIVAVLSILAIIDIIGNSLVCVVITRNPDMRYVDTKLSKDRKDDICMSPASVIKHCSTI